MTSVHGFSGATPVPRCSFLARWRPWTVWFFALIGSGRDAFGAPESLPAAALPVAADLAAAAAGAALWSSAADCAGSPGAEVVACSGVDDEPPHALSPGVQATASSAM